MKMVDVMERERESAQCFCALGWKSFRGRSTFKVGTAKLRTIGKLPRNDSKIQNALMQPIRQTLVNTLRCLYLYFLKFVAKAHTELLIMLDL